ncbi:protease SohB [Pantoea sp. Aalb]|uniref:protease SohB n=1 Tax=Pantoea sp. Aalb TaxID=2576762 RepID=UPI0013285E7E|nr:protease SohB [Pantoea sp. Aalb]MXP67396.1 protease SohB [Pantoea sp. Aalb]
MGFLSSYGLFLVKSITVVVAIAVTIIIVLNNVMLRKYKNNGQLRLIHLDEEYRQMKEDIQLAKIKSHVKKIWLKQHKKQEKIKIKNDKRNAKVNLTAKEKPTLYVIEFKGSIDANEVSSLREEISAVLSVAGPGDEVLLRLESMGGMVHSYGLAASQLQRLRDANIYLTIVVDKVAASGGYMMACVANRIIAAPFSIIGSIGVVAQIPNFNRLLKRNDIDIELHTAGQYKRTLTFFGENTEEGRKKFCDILNETHQLFKVFINEMRPSLDLEKVATGEHWYGRQALSLGLVDGLDTSDALIIRKMKDFTVLGVQYIRKRKIIDRFTHSVSYIVERFFIKIWEHSNKTLISNIK